MKPDRVMKYYKLMTFFDLSTGLLKTCDSDMITHLKKANWLIILYKKAYIVLIIVVYYR